MGACVHAKVHSLIVRQGADHAGDLDVVIEYAIDDIRTATCEFQAYIEGIRIWVFVMTRWKVYDDHRCCRRFEMPGCCSWDRERVKNIAVVLKYGRRRNIDVVVPGKGDVGLRDPLIL